jgi:aspartyl protease family protein
MLIGWALRWVLLCCGLVLLAVGMLDRGGVQLLGRAVQFRPDPQPGSSRESTPAPPSNSIVYRADQRGHVILDAAVNGAPIRMLVDTGASLVTLTPRDARAAGISPRELVYNGRVSTANGTGRMAPVTLREIRIDQLSVYDVPAAVIENLGISLLGMSFLGQLQGYEMHDGKLTITW